MKTRLLLQFSTVAHAGSITEASKRLHIAQPALSLAISNLEDDLGVKLFERHRRGVRLTDSGLVLLEHANTILRQIESARSAVVENEDNPSGPVGLAMPASVSHVLSRPVCQVVLNELPNVVLSFDEGLTGNLTRFLRSGRIDLMVDFDVETDSEFVAEPLIREDLFLLGTNIGGNQDITLEEASDYPLFLPAAQHAMGRAVQRYEREHEVQLQRFPMQLGVQPMLALVESGVGQTITPWSLIFDRIDGSDLNARRIVEPEMTRTAYLMFSQSRLQSSAARAVTSIVRQAISDAHKKGYWRGELLVTD